MGDSPASSDLSDPPSGESDGEDQTSNSAGHTSRRSIDHVHVDNDHLAPPSKRRKITSSALANFEHAPSSHAEEDDDNISVSSDDYGSAPGSPGDDEYALRDQAQTQCLWRDCDFGTAINNDELVKHVQTTHCATGGPKKTKYICEWGECQRKTSNHHPSGYALKAHMRSHTKEKPYYCALPECDKAFTRSDALAKHMRTVHEPEPLKGPANAGANDATPSGKKGTKIKLTNGSAASSKPPPNTHDTGPTHDEDGNEIDPSPSIDNISYIPAHHPVTGQPGFMIHYPPDINFTSWESTIPADHLMRILRREIHWAEKEGGELRKQIEELEARKREEWVLKEILLEGALEAELARAERDDLLRNVDDRVQEAMQRDVAPAKRYTWVGGEDAPEFRRSLQQQRTEGWNLASSAAKKKKGRKSGGVGDRMIVDELRQQDEEDDVSMRDASVDPEEAEQRPPKHQHQRRNSASPPPTGMSGGFDGDGDPYDNYVQGLQKQYEERERIRSMQNTPAKGAVAPNPDQQAAEADAVGALMGMKVGG